MATLAQARRPARVGQSSNFASAIVYGVERWYLVFVLTLWVFTPELRRLLDWQMGYKSLPIVNLLPLVSLVPPALLLLSRNGNPMEKLIKAPMWFFVGGFAYAFLIALASSNLIAGSYELASFLLPLAFAVWVLRSRAATTDEKLNRLSTSLLVLAALSSLYGLVQFAAPPPWDVVWVQNADIVSIGEPVPFGLRVFGTLNAPGPFADFLVAALLLNIRYLQFGQWWRALFAAPIIAALALTFSRTEWLALVVGLVVYAMLTPGRKKLILPMVLLAAIGLGVLLNLDTLFGSNSGATKLFTDRIATLSNLQEDDSAQTRKLIIGETWREFVAEPLGQGLGQVGTSTKLTSREATSSFDNGYLARIFEMGILGFPLFMASIVASLFVTLRLWWRSNRTNDTKSMYVLATSIALQVAIAGLDTSADHHLAFLGCLFWVTVMLGIGIISPTAYVEHALSRRPNRASVGPRAS